jgi:hypothetical protein
MDLYSALQKKISPFGNNVDGPGGHYAKWS